MRTFKQRIAACAVALALSLPVVGMTTAPARAAIGGDPTIAAGTGGPCSGQCTGSWADAQFAVGAAVGMAGLFFSGPAAVAIGIGGILISIPFEKQ